jgi:hypothetical protein
MSIIKLAFIHYKTLGPKYRKELRDNTNEVLKAFKESKKKKKHTVRNAALLTSGLYGTLGGAVGAASHKDFAITKLKGGLIGAGAGLALGASVGAMAGALAKKQVNSVEKALEERHKKLNDKNAKWLIVGGTDRFRKSEK